MRSYLSKSDERSWNSAVLRATAWSWCIAALALGLLLIHDVDGQESRVWRMQSGRGRPTELRGTLVGLRRGRLSIQTDSGQQRQVPLQKLSAADRKAALINRVGSGVVLVRTKDLAGQEYV